MFCSIWVQSAAHKQQYMVNILDGTHRWCLLVNLLGVNGKTYQTQNYKFKKCLFDVTFNLNPKICSRQWSLSKL